jgi:hypothetical protein
MHDLKSLSTQTAILNHGGEASAAQQRAEKPVTLASAVALTQDSRRRVNGESRDANAALRMKSECRVRQGEAE